MWTPRFKNFFNEHFYASTDPSDSYWLTRRLIATGLGLLYFNAFLIFYNQSPGLFGSRGLLPIQDYISRIHEHFGSVIVAFWNLPGLFNFNQSDGFISVVGLLGMIISLPVIFGWVNFPLLFALWFLHMSVIHAGQLFYSFGWETQLLELTFLSFFLFPLWDPRLNNPAHPPKKIAIYFQRWMMFRLMLGAGLIKIRGDACWTDLTCMNYHYETQPNPSPLSWLWHQFPADFHTMEVLVNHFVELIAPFGLFGPKILRRGTGLVMVLFQVSLILSGNLSWLNWLTLVMAIPCFDDEFLQRLFKFKKYFNIKPLPLRKSTGVTLSLFALAGTFLSIKPAWNLVSSEQLMNASFNQFHLINSYGAFGSIGKVRNEIIISGTDNLFLNENTEWKEYEFKCKPGDPQRRPCWITPYHLRLDWQIWFSAMRPQLSEQWLLKLAEGLLRGEADVLDLLGKNPFPENPPRYIKMDLYRYEFTRGNEKGWWKRSYIQPYMEPARLK